MIERIWTAGNAVVVAGGPSLTQEDVEFCRGRVRVVVVNDGWKLAPWADVLYGADPEWWELHQGAPNFAGIKITQDRQAATRWGLLHVESIAAAGLSPDPGIVHRGGNSGYQAINLAVHLGAIRIALLGFDMKAAPDGRKHWFGDHPTGRMDRPQNYAAWIAAFNALYLDAQAAGITLVNCSRESAIPFIPRLPLEAVLPQLERGARP